MFFSEKKQHAESRHRHRLTKKICSISHSSVLKVLFKGSSSGIGAAAALKFASLGYRLALHARNVPIDDAGLAETKDRCLKANTKLTGADVLYTSYFLTKSFSVLNFLFP